MFKTGFTFISILIALQGASAGELDQYSANAVEGMSVKKLETLFLKDHCPNRLCEFGNGGLNTARLTKAERLALWQCTQGVFETLTPALNHGKLTGSLAAYARLIDSALGRLPSKPETVYRGTTNAHETTKVGATLLAKSFLSTSGERNIAEGFIHAEAPRLLILKTRSAKNIQEYSHNGAKESLLPRGIKFHVDQVKIEHINLNEKVEVVEATELH